MSRNVQFQVLRGSQANIASAMPLGSGELYFAIDTGNLFIGIPGYGLGYVQIGDISDVSNEILILRAKVKAIELSLLNLGISIEEFEEIS